MRLLKSIRLLTVFSILTSCASTERQVAKWADRKTCRPDSDSSDFVCTRPSIAGIEYLKFKDSKDLLCMPSADFQDLVVQCLHRGCEK